MEAATNHSLVKLLQKYLELFAFGPDEMPGIDPAVMEYRLNMDPTHKLVIQKKRHMGPKNVVAPSCWRQASLGSANTLSEFQT